MVLLGEALPAATPRNVNAEIIGIFLASGRNSPRFLQRDRANVAALFAALGAAQALFHRLEWGIPTAHMGQQIGISLSFVTTRGTFQIEQILPEFIGKPNDVEIAPHARYCI
jgi:hypothetical protein